MTRHIPVIGLYSPAMGCGKTEVARILQNRFWYIKVSMAEPLKQMVDPLLSYFPPTESKEEVIPELGFSKRELYQTLGTEWGRRTLHPDFWVRIAEAHVEAIYRNEETCVVIDDIRFPNEYEMVIELGGEVWQITRPGVQRVNDHPSEGQLDGYRFHHYISNGGTLEDLEKKVTGIMRGTSLAELVPTYEYEGFKP